MIQAGRWTATVVKHWIDQTGNGSAFVAVKLALEGDDAITGKIWLTEKSMGMARGQLKSLGFDVDKQSLEDLDTNQELLKGKTVEIEIEENEYQGKTTMQVRSIRVPKDKGLLAKLTEGLRSAKKKTDEPGDEGVPF